MPHENDDGNRSTKNNQSIECPCSSCTPEAIAKHVAEWPPLTEEQKATITHLLGRR